MERKLTEEMLHKISTDAVHNWEEFTIIEELVWLYDNLAKHDKDLYQQLIENYENLVDEEHYLSQFNFYKDPREEK